jgi:single-strand DNA-binding protein
MNVVIEVGRLTSDVELKQTQSGVSVCSFTLAVYRTKEITDFLPCIAWRETAEHIARYYRKGQMIAIRGQLQSRKYEDKDKRKRTAIEIKVEYTSFCESAKAGSGEATQIQPPAEANFEEISPDEDLPF